MKKNENLEKGFTLVELLVSMIILITVGTIMVSILVSSLRTGNKSQAINDVRQNGNYAITQMSKTISYAKIFNGISTSTDGTNLVTACDGSTSYKYIQITSFDNSVTSFSCGDSAILSNGSPLTGSGVSLKANSCSFICTKTASGPPIIDIKFTLQEGVNSLIENQSFIPFETSVTLRNY